MQPDRIARLQSSIWGQFGEAVSIAAQGWTGTVIEQVEEPADTPLGGTLQFASGRTVLVFRQAAAPRLARGTLIAWRDGTWSVDSTEETSEDTILVSVMLVPVVTDMVDFDPADWAAEDWG